ncbi:hypothetical protein D9M72_610870 [compost metagenome]
MQQARQQGQGAGGVVALHGEGGGDYGEGESQRGLALRYVSLQLGEFLGAGGEVPREQVHARQLHAQRNAPADFLGR